MRVKKILITLFVTVIAVCLLGLIGCGGEKKDYKITYEADGGRVSFSTQAINYGEEIKLPSATKNGYKFCGWVYKAGSNEYPINNGDKFNFRSDITATAIWAEERAGENIYVISYNLTEGTVSGLTFYFRESSEDFTLPIPLKPNCYFKGWSGTGIDGVCREVVIKKGSTGDRTYTANFEEVYFSVELVLTCDTYNYEFKEYRKVVCAYGGKEQYSITGIGYNTAFTFQNAVPSDYENYSFLKWVYENTNGEMVTFVNAGQGATLFNYDNFSSTSVKLYVVCVPNYS